MAERTRPNSRRRARQRRSYQPALPAELRATEERQTDMQRLERWKRRVAHARHIREAWEQEYRVEQLERFFLGQHAPLGNDALRTEIYLNHFAATIQTQRPALLPTSVTFLVSSKPGQKPADQLTARTLGGVLDTIALQDGHFMKTLRLATMQAFFRAGVLKTCYEPRMEPNPRKGEPMLNEYGQPLVDDGGERHMEPDEVMTDEAFRWRWVNAQHMLFPDEGPDTTRWSWIGEEIEVPLEDAKADTTFPAGLREQLRANGTWTDPSTQTRQPREDEEPELFRYCECWDLREKRRYAWADGQSFQGFLVDEPIPDGVEDHPYALLLFVPIVAPLPSPWPKPLVADWLPIQQQYNILRTQQIEGGKRAARKILYSDATFPDADEARKYLSSSADMEAVKINDMKQPPLVVGEASVNVDVSRNIPLLIADWHYVTGASGAKLGNPDSNTATEAVLTEQAGAVRESELRTMLTEWLSEAGRKMAQLVQQSLTLDLWVSLRDMDDTDIQQFLQSPGFQAWLQLRMTPEAAQAMTMILTHDPASFAWVRERFGQLKPLQVTREKLQMEAQVSIQPSTIRPLYRAQLLQLTSLLGPAALLSPTLVEEVLHSFELPQGERITQELLANLQQQGGLAALGGGNRTAPGAPNPQSAGSPLGTQNPLGAVSGVNGL